MPNLQAKTQRSLIFQLTEESIKVWQARLEKVVGAQLSTRRTETSKRMENFSAAEKNGDFMENVQHDSNLV